MQDLRGFKVTRNAVGIPPVKLHQIQLLYPKPFQRTVDGAFDVFRCDGLENGIIRNKLGMNLEFLGQFRELNTKPSNQFLNSGVNVGTVKCGNTCFDKSCHVPDGLIRVNVSMSASQMPSALDDPRN